MKHVLKWILILIVILGGWIVILTALQEKMIFPSTKDFVKFPIPKTLFWEDVSFETADGNILNGWWLDNNADETIIFFHGNASNISHYGGRLYLLNKLEKNALFFDYRGYGKSEGKIKKEEDIYTDGEAAIDFLIQEKNIPLQSITLWGFSIGTGVATEMATRHDVSKLVLEAPFLSIPHLAKKYIPFFPVQWVLRYHMKNDEKIPTITCPILILHSPEDSQIPFSQGQELFQKANEPKQFVELTGDHDEALSKSTKKYMEALREFLR